MKTIIYTLIVIFIFGSFAMSFNNKLETMQRILIQSADKNISSFTLRQSVEIISNRLKSFGPEKFDVTAIPDKNQIQVTLDNNWDLKIAEDLILQKGTLELYETWNYKSLIELLKGDNTLMTLLQEKAQGDSLAKIGCTSPAKVKKVNEYLNSVGLNKECKFVWSDLFFNSEICLYALKLNDSNGALLRGTDIESFKFKNDTALNIDYIEVKFKQSAAGSWSDITRRNINRTIAIVLDDHLIFAPLVRSEINGGNCQITGNFTQKQVKYIAAIGNNGALPVNFEIVK